jgi:hypothetical protein
MVRAFRFVVKSSLFSSLMVAGVAGMGFLNQQQIDRKESAVATLRRGRPSARLRHLFSG